ncbi:MAG TPA: GAF domain-containing protein [Ktedonobacteraceae bacterium]|jgi:GAF domain-containing protein
MATDPKIIQTPLDKDYYTALYHAALTISSSLELASVLQGIVESVTAAMQVKAAVLRLLDPASDQLSLAAFHGLSSDYLDKGPIEISHSPIDSETLCCYPVYVSDARTDPRFQYPTAARNEGLVSVLSVPLEVQGKAIGVMRVYTNVETTFSDKDVQFLSVLASLAALSIENARLYENVKDSYSGVVAAFWGSYLPS